MMRDHLNDITSSLEREVTWFSQVCNARFEAYFKTDEPGADISARTPSWCASTTWASPSAWC
jgi:hypothetical protein